MSVHVLVPVLAPVNARRVPISSPPAKPSATYSPMTAKVFIDGHAGTIGLRIRELLTERRDLTLVEIEESRRKDPAARRAMLNSCDIAVLCLPDEAAIEAVQKSAGVSPAQKAGFSNGSYAIAHANFVLAYTKDNLAHVIYPGGVSTDDWAHDLPLLLKETWPRP